MTDMDKRIEVAVDEFMDWSVAFDNTASARRAEIMSAVPRAAFPELFTDPLQCWLAPWEATEKMITATDAGYSSPEGIYAVMRAAHLASST